MSDYNADLIAFVAETLIESHVLSERIQELNRRFQEIQERAGSDRCGNAYPIIDHEQVVMAQKHLASVMHILATEKVRD